MNRFVYLVHFGWGDPSETDAAEAPRRNVSEKVARLPQELLPYLGDPQARISAEPVESDPNVIEVTVVSTRNQAAIDAAFGRCMGDCGSGHPQHRCTVLHIRVAAGAAAVELDRIGEFNRRLALAICDVFPAEITKEQSADGKLIFRDRAGRSRVAVYLEDEVLRALEVATPPNGELMIRRLIANLSTQVRARYKPNQAGGLPLQVVGTVKILLG